MSDNLVDKIKVYWEDPNTRSIIDENLHWLEMDFVAKHLQENNRVLDVGCGDGRTTQVYSEKAKYVYGIEQSTHLYDQAMKLRLLLIKADFLSPTLILPVLFDVIISQRFLINLPTWELQEQALQRMYDLLLPKGKLILVECFDETYDEMNKWRNNAELPSVPKHWHNCYLKESLVDQWVTSHQLKCVDMTDFNIYIFLTRIYTQMFASFTGHGTSAQKDPIFKQADQAARLAQLYFKDKIKFEFPLGPIQGLVLERTL